MIKSVQFIIAIYEKDLPIKIHNIINIHGIADWDDRQNIHIKKDQTFNPPIFGIGNSNIRINDWRYIFTKKARLLSYNVNYVKYLIPFYIILMQSLFMVIHSAILTIITL